MLITFFHVVLSISVNIFENCNWELWFAWELKITEVLFFKF